MRAAVDRLYQALGEQQDTLFPATVQPLLAEADACRWAPCRPSAACSAASRASTIPEVMAWLDNAIARQADSARVAGQHMMSAPRTMRQKTSSP